MTGADPGSVDHPGYLDHLLDDLEGTAGRLLHMGHWDDPTAEPLVGTYEEGQERLSQIVLDLLDVGSDHRVLDVACGAGGVLAGIASRVPGAMSIGVDRSGRALALITQGLGRSVLRADVCALPFGPRSFDRVVSVEAMQHFPSRSRFLVEAGRVLRPGGRLVVTDLLLAREAAAAMGWTDDDLRRRLADGFDPWPEPGWTLQDTIDHARQSGLRCVTKVDATENTLPSYRAPRTGPFAGAARLSETEGARAFVALHERGLLRVAYLAFVAG